MSKMDKEFYDVQYEAWREGSNPDLITEDKWNELKSRGFAADEISVADLLPKSPRKYLNGGI
jgi:hypothetical protein